jgi:hypothetical protein
MMNQTAKQDLTRIIAIAIFAIAMGYLESAVVVYIREIYFPEGFAFPMKMMSERVIITEIFRELATLIMLAGIGIIAGRSRLERFGLFLFVFGVWDIFYYVFLYALLGWPESLFTWDILFLLPTTWVGPVIAPVINAITMVIFGLMIWNYQSKNSLLNLKRMEWAMLIIGSLIVILAYVEDYVTYMRQQFSIPEIFFPADAPKLMEYAMTYVPMGFNWWIFWVGEVVILVGIGFWHRRTGRR